MPTATKPKTAKPEAELEAAREQLDAARRERARLGEEHRRYTTTLAGLDAELRKLATADPQQFGADGQPKPKTRASELRSKLDQGASSRWPEIIRGADQGVEECEAEVRRLARPLAVELARAEYERGLEVVREVAAAGQQLREAIGRVHATEPALLEIVHAVGRPFDGRSVAVDPRWAELERMLDAIGEFAPARIPGLTVYTDEEPSIQRTSDGGWMHVSSKPKAGWAEEQPERIERPS